MHHEDLFADVARGAVAEPAPQEVGDLALTGDLLDGALPVLAHVIQATVLHVRQLGDEILGAVRPQRPVAQVDHSIPDIQQPGVAVHQTGIHGQHLARQPESGLDRAAHLAAHAPLLQRLGELGRLAARRALPLLPRSLGPRLDLILIQPGQRRRGATQGRRTRLAHDRTRLFAHHAGEHAAVTVDIGLAHVARAPTHPIPHVPLVGGHEHPGAEGLHETIGVGLVRAQVQGLRHAAALGRLGVAIARSTLKPFAQSSNPALRVLPATILGPAGAVRSSSIVSVTGL